MNREIKNRSEDPRSGKSLNEVVTARNDGMHPTPDRELNRDLLSFGLENYFSTIIFNIVLPSDLLITR